MENQGTTGTRRRRIPDGLTGRWVLVREFADGQIVQTGHETKAKAEFVRDHDVKMGSMFRGGLQPIGHRIERRGR